MRNLYLQHKSTTPLGVRHVVDPYIWERQYKFELMAPPSQELNGSQPFDAARCTVSLFRDRIGKIYPFSLQRNAPHHLSDMHCSFGQELCERDGPDLTVVSANIFNFNPEYVTFLIIWLMYVATLYE